MRDAYAVILDLRGNTGGSDAVMLAVAGSFADRGTSLGFSTTRQGVKEFTVSPDTHPYLGPLVIMIDCVTGSSSEQLAAGFQETGRAVIIGVPSQGNNLDAHIKELPTGALLIYDGRRPNPARCAHRRARRHS